LDRWVFIQTLLPPEKEKEAWETWPFGCIPNSSVSVLIALSIWQLSRKSDVSVKNWMLLFIKLPVNFLVTLCLFFLAGYGL